VKELSAGDPRFRDDRGGADPAVTDALAGFADGICGEREVLTALAGARLLVPVVAVVPGPREAESARTGRAGTGPGATGPGEPAAGEKDSEMAVPTIIGRDGRAALPAFTSIETLQRWRPAARPVPVPAASVWESAVEQAQAVIVDIAGPVPFAIEGSRLHALASSHEPPFLHEDPDVHAAVAAAAASQPPGVRIRLGRPAADADLLLELAAADPAGTVPPGLADSLAADIAARLGGRIRRGIAVRVQGARPVRGD
jgi:hypothetical protein